MLKNNVNDATLSGYREILKRVYGMPTHGTQKMLRYLSNDINPDLFDLIDRIISNGQRSYLNGNTVIADANLLLLRYLMKRFPKDE